MQKIEISTAQNVSIWMPHAGIGRRFVAFLLDWVVKILYFIVILFAWDKLFFRTNFDLFDFEMNTTYMVVYTSFFIPITFYTLLSEYFMSGTTIGKLIMGIKVVKINGFEARFHDYFMRWIFMLIDVYIYGIIGIVSVASSKKGQRLGDKVAGTCVIWLREKSDLSKTILTELTQGYKPVYHSVINLSDNDMRIIKENMEKLEKKYNQKLMKILCDKVIDVMGETPKNGVADLNFLKTIIKDYNYLTRDSAA
ncbi:MAG: RDD family protein [Bacteroidales bacterium]